MTDENKEAMEILNKDRGHFMLTLSRWWDFEYCEGCKKKRLFTRRPARRRNTKQL